MKFSAEFLYFGIIAWIYSVAVQTPVAFLYWGVDWDQYVRWAAAGLPITVLFFGWPLKAVLDRAGRLITPVPVDVVE